MKARPAITRIRRERGYTLLEVLVATALMGIAVAGVLSALSATARNAARVNESDLAVRLARQKMDELLLDPRLPYQTPLEGRWDERLIGTRAGWRAVVRPFEALPGSGPMSPVLESIVLEVWWMSGPAQRRTLQIEGYRRGLLPPDAQAPPLPPLPEPILLPLERAP
jgi:general secretion pathway protein I